MSEVSFAANMVTAITRIVAIQKIIDPDSEQYKSSLNRSSTGGAFWQNSVLSVSQLIEVNGARLFSGSADVLMVYHYANVTEGDSGVADELLMWTIIPLTMQTFTERPLLRSTTSDGGVNSLRGTRISDGGRQMLGDRMIGSRFILTLNFMMKLDFIT